MNVDEFNLASPCAGVCILDPESGQCRGCYRTVDEIASWGALDRDGRLAILARVRERRCAAGQDRRRTNARRGRA